MIPQTAKAWIGGLSGWLAMYVVSGVQSLFGDAMTAVTIGHIEQAVVGIITAILVWIVPNKAA